MRRGQLIDQLRTALCAAFLLPVLSGSEFYAQEHSAGYETLRIVDDDRARPIHLDVWYPTTRQQEQEHNYGLSIGRIASGATVTGMKLPVVLLSHGAMGAASNYSWIAEHLARRGYAVLGVSHFGESPVFGPQSVDPAAVSRLGERAGDLAFALEFFLERSSYASRLDSSRLGAIGHSSGGASVLMLTGAEFSATDLASYCRSRAAASDKGCRYPSQDGGKASGQAAPEPSKRRMKALVALDPAVGPGFTDRALQAIMVPSLVIGSVENDFLTYPFHAGRISRLIPRAETVRLENGEGHFVYLDECAAPVDVMGVPLCSDRKGVDRKAVHERLAMLIEQFLARHLAAGAGSSRPDRSRH
jgi:predicted dienelactone hydrolase